MSLRLFNRTLVAATCALSAGNTFADTGSYSSLQAFLRDSTPTGNFNLRYESVDVEGGGSASDGITLRSRVGFKTPSHKGFSAVVELENITDMFGVDDEKGRIPDPEGTEIDQAYLQYKTSNMTAKVGRQVITLDGHRFVGHVGWRQDRQTFDAVRVMFTPMKDLKIDTSYIYQRNRIFAETADADSSDILINASYKTPTGKLVGYYYGLDDKKEGPANAATDTVGGFISGSTKGDVTFLYTAEFATQSIDIDDGRSFDADYLLLEAGVKFKGVTAKIGREVLGSDDGLASFSTPLATLHKFNGWSDVTLGGVFNPLGLPAGLQDDYVSIGGNVAGIKLAAVYHAFSPDEGGGDYGSEVNLLAVKKLGGGFSIGAKYADFSDDSSNGAFAADVKKLWLWTTFTF